MSVVRKRDYTEEEKDIAEWKLVLKCFLPLTRQ